MSALRARIMLQRPTLAPDDLGAGAPSYADVALVWARIDPLGVDGARVSQRVEIRTRRDVRPGWRIRRGAQRFVVRAVIDADALGARLHLYCEEDIQ